MGHDSVHSGRVILLVLQLRPSLRARDLLHRPFARQFVYELIEVAGVLLYRVLHGRDVDAADRAGDERTVGVERGRLVEKVLIGQVAFELPCKPRLVVVGELAGDGVDLLGSRAKPAFWRGGSRTPSRPLTAISSR